MGGRLKRRLPVIPHEREGGVYLALAGNTRGEVHIILSDIGSVCSILSFLLAVIMMILSHDDKEK